IFIDGQEGTTGLKIHKRLQGRNDLELLAIAEEERKDPEARLELMKQADISFLCLPDAASREIAERADKNWRILDTSTAHRTDKNWVYGFPELDGSQRNKIKESNRVAVPGCHATGFISLVKPMISLNIIDKDYPFTCHSITGYSGGGKSMIAQYKEENRAVSFDSPRQYGLDQNHKHLAEMIAITEIGFAPVFHPIVADYYSGMLVTISLHSRLMNKKLKPQELRQELSEYYKNEPMIQVRNFGEKPADGFMAANVLAETDGLEVYVLGNEEQITLMARYDNLGKGASGAAIQCMNIMLNLPENTGLVI
ncbi:MAG TPA: N-acetyl-gamma-glutamyl-phosphate reductase, partial [Anaerovoracaceae bacterium]|nr:N-acetyl-gamma-glutamyl-phosphate reductase [Anaerovoracaceae bacterium]